jgi:hypothetical protein
MKKSFIIRFATLLLVISAIPAMLYSQDSTGDAKPEVTKAPPKPVKNTFEGIWIIDNQTVMVPIKGTFEIDIMHRFGLVKNGYEDFWGFFAPSNIRLGFNYVPVKKLLVGASITKANMTWEGYLKYAILQQTPGRFPISATYYGDIAIDSRTADNFVNFSDRLMYFNQVIIARKISNRISLQVVPTHTHVNVVDGYFSEPGKYEGVTKHEHFSISTAGRFKIKENMGFVFNYDQPLTKHPSNNPSPNLAFGLELSTSAHSFQFFVGNFNYITPSRNNYYNQNDYKEGEFLIGFNITRLWNY